MNPNQAIENVIRARAQAKREKEYLQRQLLPENDDFKATIEMKLAGRWDSNQYWNFCRCGVEKLYRRCENCGTETEFLYRCSLKWCPRCQWWITEKRKRILQLWTCKVFQPKHLVLTQRNFPILTRARLREHTRALAKMRRSKCFKSVQGGCVTVEITNEERGWHVHSHWLIDVRWLDMEQVSTTWAKLVGQGFSIVKIKDCRGKSYLQEVSKYVCDGSEIAKWAPELILEFVTAVRGRRFFFPFGSLFHAGPAIRAELRAGENHGATCECGCSNFVFKDETDIVLEEARRLCEQTSKRGKPKQPKNTNHEKRNDTLRNHNNTSLPCLV